MIVACRMRKWALACKYPGAASGGVIHFQAKIAYWASGLVTIFVFSLPDIPHSIATLLSCTYLDLQINLDKLFILINVLLVGISFISGSG